MVDEQAAADGSAPYRCPWCSAELSERDLQDCPSCGATLTATAQDTLPGVTSIDHEAIARNAREAVRQPRSRLFSWLSGEYSEEESGPSDAVAPPDLAVRREMLRLRVQAEIADRQAEADALMADAAIEGRPVPGFLFAEAGVAEPSVEGDVGADIEPGPAAATGGEAAEAPASPEAEPSADDGTAKADPAV